MDVLKRRSQDMENVQIGHGLKIVHTELESTKSFDTANTTSD